MSLTLQKKISTLFLLVNEQWLSFVLKTLGCATFSIRIQDVKLRD
jgi:hypothetical protein